MTPPATPPLSQRAYAKRRGVSVEAVSKAISSGRLVECVVMVDAVAKIADPELADLEWELNTNARVDSPTAAARDQSEYYANRSRREDAAADRERADAELTAIKLAEKRRELVPAKDVEMAWRTMITHARNKLLGVPTRARQRDPSLNAAQLALIDELIRAALADLSRAHHHPEPEATT